MHSAIEIELLINISHLLSFHGEAIWVGHVTGSSVYSTREILLVLQQLLRGNYMLFLPPFSYELLGISEISNIVEYFT